MDDVDLAPQGGASGVKEEKDGSSMPTGEARTFGFISISLESQRPPSNATC